MKSQVISNKKYFLICTLLLSAMLAVFSPLFLKSVHAETLAQKNSKAHTLYIRKARSLKGVYKFMDLTNDGIHEGLIEYHPGNSGSGRYLLVYTYQNGAIRQLLKFGEYGLYKVAAFKYAKAFVLAGAGHGGEWIANFRYSNGQFIQVCEKTRRSIGNYPWNYFGANTRTTITKAKYDSLTKTVRKGKKAESFTQNWAS